MGCNHDGHRRENGRPKTARKKTAQRERERCSCAGRRNGDLTKKGEKGCHRKRHCLPLSTHFQKKSHWSDFHSLDIIIGWVDNHVQGYQKLSADDQKLRLKRERKKKDPVKRETAVSDRMTLRGWRGREEAWAHVGTQQVKAWLDRCISIRAQTIDLPPTP